MCADQARGLVRDPATTKHPNWLQYRWVRPENFRGVSSPRLFVKNEVEGDQIQQGVLGDCWLLSAMTVLTKRKEFQQVFVTTQHNAAGFYSVNLYHNGQRANVIVDSLFPVN